MEKLKKILIDESIILITFGKPFNKDEKKSKLKISPITIKDSLMYQVAYIVNNQSFQENIKEKALTKYVTNQLHSCFKNSNIFTTNHDYQVFVNKSEKVSIIKNNPTKKMPDKLVHNKKKKYLIDKEDRPDFLIKLGIMDNNYIVIPKSYAKFRQINRFVEIINDEIEIFNDKIRVVDFCCGKGYMTLATWFYLKHLKKKQVDIIGMDLKGDMIDYLKTLSYKDMNFYEQDITTYNHGPIDLAIALHACDVATDISIIQAIKHKAKVILMVPCCQHELFTQITYEPLEPLLKHGILKDKMTELLTNTLRGLALEAMGYQVKMVEFTSLEHTMKNIMIKAVYTGKKNKDALKQYKEIERDFNVNCYINKLFTIDNKSSD
ncbi:MAG: SAM-dependent methyltransferase [Clostridiales bacterium]|nr:SAM-dependent methyltransferase [Clostridiales bacterium]